MNIRIFMCCHNGFDTVPPFCVPIQCGSALNPPVDGALPDNMGDSISEKNHQYCELTAHYYVWKNVNADYYGFCHYRRFFCFGENCKRPYIVRKKLSQKDIALLGSPDEIEKTVQKYDIVIPKSENMGLSVREHYITAKYHRKEDLELFIRLIKEKYTYLSDSADQYLAQSRQYFCNMFIMKRDIFFEYCEMLFGALNEFDKLKKSLGMLWENRTDGYLGEIFTGIFVYHKRQNGLRVRDIARLDVSCSAVKIIGYLLFPPESGTRFMIKKAIKKMRRDKYTKKLEER